MRSVHFVIEVKHLFFIIGMLVGEGSDDVGDRCALFDLHGDFCPAVEDQVESAAEVGLHFDGLVH